MGEHVSWVEDIMEGALDDPAGRLVGVECGEIAADGDVVGRVTLRFTIEDFRGDTVEVGGKIFLPSSLRDDPTTKLPLLFHCGYEIPDEMAPWQVGRGRVAATTIQAPEGAIFPGSWAIARGPNQEIVLSHLLRSLPFVDPAAIAYAGGSAGGYACLMAATEAFPLAVAVPGVPLVNLAYCCAYLRSNAERLLPAEPPAAPDETQAFLLWFRGLVTAWEAVFGADLDGPGWLAHSPVGHLDRLTCPIATLFSTVDILVPIDQVDRTLAKAVRTAQPGGLEMAAELLSDAAAPQVRLLDLLGDRADVHVITVGDDVPVAVGVDLTLLGPQPPMGLPDVTLTAGRWLVAVADGGEPVMGQIHFKHALSPDFEPHITRAIAAGIGVEQLTPAKLDQLLDRHRGVEWLAEGFQHLDRPEAEQADVARGLRAYCATSPEHRRRFVELYAAAAPERRVLPPELVTALSDTAG